MILSFLYGYELLESIKTINLLALSNYKPLNAWSLYRGIIVIASKQSQLCVKTNIRQTT